MYVTCTEPVGPERRDTNLHPRKLLSLIRFVQLVVSYPETEKLGSISIFGMMENYSQYKKIIWKYLRTLQYDYMYLRRRHFGRVDYPQISESIIRMK